MGAIVPPKYVPVPINFLKLYIALGEFQSIPDAEIIFEYSMFLVNFCYFFGPATPPPTGVGALTFQE